MTTILAILIMPMIFAVVISYSQLSILIKYNLKTSLFFFSGFVAYFLIHFNKSTSRFINYIYVFSHEITHTIFAIFSGNRVKKIKISSRNGYVSFEGKTNIVTAISPYIFPFYNIITAIIYLIARKYYSGDISNIFILAQGFFLSFHIINTIDAISLNQKDFKEGGGRFLSTVIIILFNLIFTAIIINVIVSKNNEIIYSFIKSCLNYYVMIIKNIFYRIAILFAKIKNIML